MKRIAEALDVARSRLAERMGNTPEKRPPRYSKEQDSVLLPLLREITDERATLGYRRATVFLNRRLAQMGLPPVNHKRVYRIMRLSQPSSNEAYRPTSGACSRRKGHHLAAQSALERGWLRDCLRKR